MHTITPIYTALESDTGSPDSRLSSTSIDSDGTPLYDVLASASSKMPPERLRPPASPADAHHIYYPPLDQDSIEYETALRLLTLMAINQEGLTEALTAMDKSCCLSIVFINHVMHLYLSGYNPGAASLTEDCALAVLPPYLNTLAKLIDSSSKFVFPTSSNESLTQVFRPAHDSEMSARKGCAEKSYMAHYFKLRATSDSPIEINGGINININPVDMSSSERLFTKTPGLNKVKISPRDTYIAVENPDGQQFLFQVLPPCAACIKNASVFDAVKDLDLSCSTMSPIKTATAPSSPVAFDSPDAEEAAAYYSNHLTFAESMWAPLELGGHENRK